LFNANENNMLKGLEKAYRRACREVQQAALLGTQVAGTLPSALLCPRIKNSKQVGVKQP